jgi:beta-mannosidase
VGRDRLASAAWTCCATAAGAVTAPDELDKLALEWMAAAVPGTAAAAVTAASGWRYASTVDFDTSDWWFRCRVPDGTVDAGASDTTDSATDDDGPWVLTLEGLATVADVWVGDRHVLHSENMFVPQTVELEAVPAGQDIVLRFAALTPLLAAKRPRPRWKTQMVNHQSLRWFRTSYLGRQPGWVVTPAAVGPWRPVRLESDGRRRVTERRVVARCAENDSGAGHENGVVAVTLRLAGGVPGTAPDGARLRVRRSGDSPAGAGPSVEGSMVVTVEGSDVVVHGELAVPGIERWWPHTHGAQPLYAVSVEIGAETIEVGRVGFREVGLDRRDGAFTLSVNGVEVFCRGACWWPVDALGLHGSDEALRATLDLVVAAHMNMVRIPGGTVYEDGRFWDLCDELGIMVWQDSMLGYTDPPQDAEFEAAVVTELEHVFGNLGGRPALAVVCGGQEIEEQAAMFGLARATWTFPLVETVIPALAGQRLPGVPYVTSSPTGGDLPFQPDAGDCHYWGVGSFLRPPEDARLSGIRFMSEGIGLATPPERQTVDEACGGAMAAGHDPQWKRAVHHDTGRSWDLDDVRDFYVQKLLGVDPHLLRYLDPERALDLGRAVSGELVGRTLGEWRRPGSTCAGGLTVALRDLVPGAGWGLIDALGRPKAPWFTLRRVLAPVAVLVSDEGLNGLHLHMVNDSDEAVAGEVTVEVFARGEVRVEQGRQAVAVAARGHQTVEAGTLFDGFRDLSYSYRFGPPAHDVVAVTWRAGDGRTISEVVHLPAGLERPYESEVGLAATAEAGSDGEWSMTVTTRRLAQWVVVEVPGYRPSDSYFHLAPGATRTVTLHPESGVEAVPSGLVRALNAQTTARIVVA